MEGSIKFDNAARAMDFSSLLANLANDSLLAQYELSLRFFRDLPEMGIGQASAVVRNARRKLGGKALEAAASAVSPTGDYGWALLVEDQIETDLDLIEPKMPKLLAIGGSIDMDGFSVQFTGRTVNVDAPDWGRVASSDMADCLDTSLVSFGWLSNEGALLSHNGRAVRVSGMFRKERTYQANA